MILSEIGDRDRSEGTQGIVSGTYARERKPAAWRPSSQFGLLALAGSGRRSPLHETSPFYVRLFRRKDIFRDSPALSPNLILGYGAGHRVVGPRRVPRPRRPYDVGALTRHGNFRKTDFLQCGAGDFVGRVVALVIGRISSAEAASHSS